MDTATDSVAAALLQAFAQLGGPALDTWAVQLWRHADTESPLEAGCAWDARGRLGLCGDWINGGKLQGVWLSRQATSAPVARRQKFAASSKGASPERLIISD